MRRVLLFGVLLALACGGPEGMDMGVPVPAFRIAGSDRLAQETWIAHVAVEDDAIRVRVNYDPADGGPRERTLDGTEVPLPEALDGKGRVSATLDEGRIFRRVATVLHASTDHLWNRTLRRLPGDDTTWIPRLFVAGRGGATLPVFVPAQYAEVEFARLGPALNRQDMALGLRRNTVSAVWITREDGRVRYRWARADRNGIARAGTGGDRSFTPEDVQAAGPGVLLPDLARFLSTRMTFPTPPPVALEILNPRAKLTTRSPVAVVFLDVTDEVHFVDVLRAIECAERDPEVLFYSSCYHQRQWMGRGHHWQVRVPPADRELDQAYWRRWPRAESPQLLNLTRTGEGTRAQVASLAMMATDLERCARNTGGPPREINANMVLRFDGRCPWSVARIWVRRCQAAGMGLLLRYQFGDYGLEPETELALPPLTDAPRLSLALNAVAARTKEARDRLVRLTAPDSATVGDVWQAVLTLMDAGATGIDFE